MEYTLLEIIIIFILTIGIHETGHAIGYWIMNKKPKIEFKWGIIYIGGNVSLQLRSSQLIYVALLGIYTGYVYLILLQVNTIYLAIYFVMCAIDIAVIMNVLPYWRDKRTLYDIFKENAKKDYNLIEADTRWILKNQ